MMFTVMLMAIMGAVMNRARGGWLTSSGGADAITACVFGVCLYILTGAWFAIPLAMATMWLGAVFSWGEYISDVLKDRTNYRAVAALSLRGAVWGFSLSLMMAMFHGFLYMPYIGLLMGPVYWVASRAIEVFVREDDNLEWQFGEVLWGAVLWGCVPFLI